MRGKSWRGRRLRNRREFCEPGEHLSLGCAWRNEKGWFSRCFRKIFFSDEARSIGRVKCARAIHGKYMVFGPNIWPALGPGCGRAEFGCDRWPAILDGIVVLRVHDLMVKWFKRGDVFGCQERQWLILSRPRQGIGGATHDCA
jgi:hypothetical protein